MMYYTSSSWFYINNSTFGVMYSNTTQELFLYKLELPWMTPRSNFYSVKYRSCIKPENIQVKSKKHLADLFIKCLGDQLSNIFRSF